MVFWSQVTVEEADLAVISVLGQPVDPPSSALIERSVHWPGCPRQDFLVPREKLDTVVQELEAQGGSLAGLMTFTAERVRAREPELAADLDAKTIAHEVPHWIRRNEENPAFVHLDKGCYRGQETVARVENLGRSPVCWCCSTSTALPRSSRRADRISRWVDVAWAGSAPWWRIVIMAPSRLV